MDFDQLVSLLRKKASGHDRIVVALSGGVDSGLVAAASHASGDAVAVTVRTELTPARDAEQALAVAHHIGMGHEFLRVDILENPDVRANPVDRCYHCKRTIFQTITDAYGAGCLLVDGTNADDDPARPGLRAVKEYNVFSPLFAAGLKKAEVRTISNEIGLPNWNTPSESCLATRFRVGIELESDALAQVEAMESFFHDLGVDTLRVKPDNLVAIVEYLPQYTEIMKNNADNFMALIRKMGLRSCRFKEWDSES